MMYRFRCFVKIGRPWDQFCATHPRTCSVYEIDIARSAPRTSCISYPKRARGISVKYPLRTGFYPTYTANYIVKLRVFNTCIFAKPKARLYAVLKSCIHAHLSMRTYTSTKMCVHAQFGNRAGTSWHKTCMVSCMSHFVHVCHEVGKEHYGREE